MLGKAGSGISMSAMLAERGGRTSGQLDTVVPQNLSASECYFAALESVVGALQPVAFA